MGDRRHPTSRRRLSRTALTAPGVVLFTRCVVSRVLVSCSLLFPRTTYGLHLYLALPSAFVPFPCEQRRSAAFPFARRCFASLRGTGCAAPSLAALRLQPQRASRPPRAAASGCVAARSRCFASGTEALTYASFRVQRGLLLAGVGTAALALAASTSDEPLVRCAARTYTLAGRLTHAAPRQRCFVCRLHRGHTAASAARRRDCTPLVHLGGFAWASAARAPR